MLYVCGDTHGAESSGCEKLNTTEWPEQKDLSPDDILVILGDFGFFWDLIESKSEKYWLNWLLEKKCTVCFIDGNHENFDIINNFPVTTWNGGTVHVTRTKGNKHIYHLMRGEVFTIEGYKIFTMGGALSTDKENRKMGISWWPEEIPNNREWYYADKNLLQVENSVDFILSHTAPRSIIEAMGWSGLAEDRYNDPTAKAFDSILETVRFKQWHFGHFHVDVHYKNKFFCHYNNKPLKLF